MRCNRALSHNCRYPRVVHVPCAHQMLMPKAPIICVLGAGVAGLTSARRLLDKFPDAAVTIVADAFNADTTSHGAGGVWGPYRLGDSPDELIHRLSADTHDHLLRLCYSSEGPRAGISLVSGHFLFKNPEPDPFWHDIVLEYHRLDVKDLAVYPERFIDGYGYTTVVCEGRRYLPWLMASLKADGARVVQTHINKLDELTQSNGEHWSKPDLVVNCCGNTADKLLDDKEAYPVRGQVARLRAPWVRHFVFADPAYIIPNQDYVVVGGTSQKGDFNLRVSLEDKEAILKNTRELVPSLEAAEHLEDWVGLRPGRTSLRLESEHLGGVPVVHNYGHGGSGMTLAWGCAGDVVRLAEEAL